MHSLVIALVTILLQVASAKTVDDAAPEESESERILYGQEAKPFQFPWMVALYYGNQFICGSSIISPTTVLTAAHCVIIDGQLQPPELFHAIANYDRSSPEVRIDFKKMVHHKDFNVENLEYDIAIGTPTEPINFSDKVKPVCIARPNTPMMEYWTATAMGWGSVFLILPFMDTKLRYAEQSIIDNYWCSKFADPVNKNKMCTKGINRISNGDSGGPLVHFSADKPPVQIGIASYINPHDHYNLSAFAVWTRVSSYYDFIMMNSEDRAICTV